MKIEPARRAIALGILEKLCQHLRCITADVVFEALAAHGFGEDERVRLTGAIIRTASARRWIFKTSHYINSVKNNSNLQILWQSALLDNGLKRGLTAQAIAAQYQTWEQQGLKIPHFLAFDFEQTKGKNVSA